MNRFRHNRREFLGLTGAGLAGFASSSILSSRAFGSEGPAADPHHADLVVFNANVYTIDAGMAKAEAFAVTGGKFVFVGSSDEARTLIGKKTQALDAKKMTIVPGFIDCHNHAGGD